MAESAIGWTDAVWNCVVGCSRVSAGCQRCYAEVLAHRLAAMGQGKYRGLTKKVGGEVRWTGEVRFVEDALTLPLTWRKPRRVFVNSMSDLFHERVADEWIDRIFAVMALAPQHTFQVLTKRPERMRAYFSTREPEEPWRRDWNICGALREHHAADERWLDADFRWPLPNVHLGVSVEDQATADQRIPLLLATPAAVRWVSYEPALGPVDFSAWLTRPNPHPATSGARTEAGQGHRESREERDTPHAERSCDGRPSQTLLNWVVIGGESGPGARPFHVAWARSVIAQCRAAGVPVFMKQLGAHPVCVFDEWDGTPQANRWGDGPALTDRKGGDMSEWPEDLRVREFPR